MAVTLCGTTAAIIRTEKGSDWMKIDEVIENAEEKARVHEYHADFLENGNPMRDACLKSSKDCKQLAEWLMQLKEYQSLEEQGRLVKLPCKVGTDIYYILGIPNETPCTIDSCVFELSDINKIGKTLFLTKSEAESKLKELIGEEDE